MSNEHLGRNPEQKSPAELEAAHTDKMAELKEAFADTDPADRAEKRAEQAREKLEHATAEPEPVPRAETESAPRHRPHPHLNHHLNYAQTMASVQRRLTPVSRTFSRFIHAPAIEKASEALESNVARPSVLLGTTWTALIVGTIFYLTARHYGFALSGSELLFSFLVGGLLGLVLEGLWLLLRRRPR